MTNNKMNTITYQAPDFKDRSKPDNAEEVAAFVGPQPACEVCGGSGEYESGWGPKGCDPCNSRLIAFVDHSGKTVYADWGDTIERRDDGLWLIREEDPFEDRSMLPKTQTLADALPLEIQRCQELLEAYKEIGPPGALAHAMISADIFDAQKAMAEGDVVAMLRAYENLKGSD